MPIIKVGSGGPKFFTVMLSVAILLSGICIASFETGAMSVIENAFRLVSIPVQSFFNSTVDFFIDKKDYFSDISKLKSENERLKKENAELMNKVNKSDLLIQENEWLYSFIDLKKERTELSFINSKILGHDSSNYMVSFTLDKGSFHGVKKGMPVINENGLVGIVCETAVNSSKGLSIINHSTSVGVYVERTGVSAVLKGNFDLYGEGLCEIPNLPSGYDIIQGDKIFTSGLGNVYPKDILVGTVTEIRPNQNNNTVSAIISPAASMNFSDRVMIVTDSATVYE